MLRHHRDSEAQAIHHADLMGVMHKQG